MKGFTFVLLIADELWDNPKDFKHVSRQSHKKLQDECFLRIKLQLTE